MTRIMDEGEGDARWQAAEMGDAAIQASSAKADGESDPAEVRPGALLFRVVGRR